MSLIELMIALLILAIGLGAITTLLATAIATNSRNNWDTTATLLAQKVIEQIAAVNPAAVNNVTITDCAGNVWNVSTVDAPGPTGAGADLVNNPASVNYGAIDQAQDFFAIPAGYAMRYVNCTNAGGVRTIYDVRWNIMTLRAGSTRLITASARLASSSANRLGGRLYAVPVNLRSIGATP
jgi:Tfp pilus assembly protein PilV